MELAGINGNIVPLAEATVNVEDRGLQFGDSVYEVIRIYNGVPFRLENHLSRLKQSAAGLSLPLPENSDGLARQVTELVQRSGIPEGTVYIQLTRGTAPRGHGIPAGIKPTLIMVARPLEDDHSGEREKGVKVVLLPDLRWRHCRLKTTNLLANVLAREEARQQGAQEAVFYEQDDQLTEGAVSNIFLVRNRALCTPGLECNILPGVTRDLVLDLAAGEGIETREEKFYAKDLFTAEEAFITSTTYEIAPVVKVGESIIGDGEPGEVTRFLQRVFTDLTIKECGKK